MQQILIAGDTLRFLTSVPDYPATDGYTLTYRLVRRDAAGTVITIVASASGADYDVNELPATTAGWAAGKYTWAAYAEKALERHTVDQGEIEIKADPGVVTAPYDNRTHAAKVLASIEAVLEGRAAVDQQELTIAGRSLKLTPVADLIKLRQLYKNEVRAEEAAARVAAGLGGGGKVLLRF